MKQVNFGLLAPELVRWLISEERPVKEMIQKFIKGEYNGDLITVAGPPSMKDAARYGRNRHAPVGLPTVDLKLAFVTHHLTGEIGVSVTCSDEDLIEINRWKIRNALRKARAA